MIIVDTFRSFEYELGNYSQYYIRPPCGNVRAHMISCLHGPLLGCDTKLIHQVRTKGYVTSIKEKYLAIIMQQNIKEYTYLSCRCVMITTVHVIIMKQLTTINIR